MSPPSRARQRHIELITLGVLALVCAGCAPGGRTFERRDDATDVAFDPAHVLTVEIELPDADFAVLRTQGRTLADLCSPESPFDYFTATVTVDGMRFEDVEIRKKGFFGSLSDERPSLKLRFAEDAGPYGLRRMTLNNDRQDPSHLRQCLSYGVMAAAGVPSPRCNYARVTVNGEALGVYTHVDSMNKPCS